MIAEYIEGSEAFVRLVAGMTVEGDCEEHLHNLEACTDSREVDQEACCDVACTVYQPEGNDQEVDTLYQLIAIARRIKGDAPRIRPDESHAGQGLRGNAYLAARQDKPPVRRDD